MKVNILTNGFSSPNGKAFLFPLIVWSSHIENAGIKLNYYEKLVAGIKDCDVLIIDNKYFSPFWSENINWVEETIEKLCIGKHKTFWFDITDSSGWDHPKALVHVTALIKNQVLKDKNKYLQPMYGGGRLFSEFAYQNFDVEDTNPTWSIPVSKKSLLEKIHIGWNSGLADYSLYGPAKMALFNKIRIPALLNFPEIVKPSSEKRQSKISCRFGTHYERESVAWQRKRIKAILAHEIYTDKVSRRKYYKELCNSKVIVSPFGLGEITLKDFEVFLSGGALFKPDMSHMQTWPSFFEDGKTMETFSWDLSNFHEKLQLLLSDKERRLAIADIGQKTYRKYTVAKNASQLFIEHFKSIISIGD